MAERAVDAQISDYLDFLDRGEMIYLPYLMYFNQPNFRSATINTDQFGFRMSHGPSGRASVGGDRLDGPVRLLVGGSGSLGYGATNDGATLASRLWMKHAPSRPWLNFGAPYFNSTQELMLFVLYRQLARRLGLRYHSDGAVRAATDKLTQRQRLRDAGLRVPRFQGARATRAGGGRPRRRGDTGGA